MNVNLFELEMLVTLYLPVRDELHVVIVPRNQGVAAYPPVVDQYTYLVAPGMQPLLTSIFEVNGVDKVPVFKVEHLDEVRLPSPGHAVYYLFAFETALFRRLKHPMKV
jgi:hypothetical protein